jgi:hypothetical protein
MGKQKVLGDRSLRSGLVQTFVHVRPVS